MVAVFVGDVTLMPSVDVTPVGTVFAIIPVVVVMVMRVVDAKLNSGILRRRGHKWTAYCESCRQEEPAYE